MAFINQQKKKKKKTLERRRTYGESGCERDRSKEGAEEEKP